MKRNKIENIYIRLLEGPETWVPVPAMVRGDNIFEVKGNKYLDLEEDISSIWEFFPGDLVRCTTKDGDFVALELLESTFPNRKLHQLIFLIVRNLGKIPQDQLQEFEHEIKLLCSDNSILQREHPVVKKWLNNNCEEKSQK